jgi:predicted house-cleaning noncanonical NTP pyrophosphatase (MazG superfamily)
MSDIFILPGPHFSAKSERSEWRREEVGLKAVGLVNLPITWTPPFIVITTAAFKLWKESSSIGELRKSLAFGLAPILGAEPRRLIVRSSASAENIDCRGWLESVVCAATCDDVLRGADKVWARANNTPKIVADGFGLVVQQFKAAKLHGHLSNERRVSRNRDVWLCEVETPMAGAATKAIRFRAKTRSRKMESPSMLCSSQWQLIQWLKNVARWCLAGIDRNHLEWVWDGEHLWIVQRDTEKEVRGDRPACSPILRPLLRLEPPKLKLFSKGDETTRWKKTESLRIFANAGLEVAQLYVLQDPRTLSEMAAGKISAGLKTDLTALLESPIVFRTDFLTEDKMPKLLSTRSDTLSSFDQATAWLMDKAQKIVSEGIAPQEFCFIGHRYIPARSAAICLAYPDRPQVRIDAIWGFPDGLLCFPHDTFHVSAEGRGKIERRIRCKPFCLSADVQGNWMPTRCPAPWDWHGSLEDSEIREIAIMSRAVARHLKQPVEVMFFVGVHEDTGYPAILPWIHFADTLTEKVESDHFHYAGKSFTITNAADLKRLEPSIVEARKTDKVAIHLRPTPGLLRDKDFVQDVTEAAKRTSVPVQLEGSILSHIYYMLTKSGVKVRCVDAAAAPRNRQRFGKLVRDLIDVKIRAGGEIARTFQVPKDELIRLLKAKALEEAFELFRAEDPALAFEELVDILEVVVSTCKAYNRSFEELSELAAKKRRERGGFEKGIVLVETEAVPLLGTPPLEPSLFGGAEPTGESARKRHRKSAQAARTFGATRRPRVRGKEIAIPMIPPHPTETSVQTVVAMPDGEHQAIIRYLAKEVMVELRKNPSEPPNPNQMWLDLR